MEESHSVYLEFPKGDPREPMTMTDLENKFNALSATLLTSERPECFAASDLWMRAVRCPRFYEFADCMIVGFFVLGHIAKRL